MRAEVPRAAGSATIYATLCIREDTHRILQATQAVLQLFQTVTFGRTVRVSAQVRTLEYPRTIDITCPMCRNRPVECTVASLSGAYCRCPACGHMWHHEGRDPARRSDRPTPRRRKSDVQRES